MTRRSIVWDYFETVSTESVVCLLCKNVLSKHEHAGTTAMLRHLRAKHPKEAATELGRTDGQEASTGQQPMDTDGAQVEVELEEADCNTVITVNDTDIDSALNGILVAVQGEPMEERKEEDVVKNTLPSRTKSQRRSIIWRHFERLESSDGCQCLICNKKIKCSSEGSTGNLHKHMSKRHPHVNLRTGEVLKQSPSDTSSRTKSKDHRKTCPAKVTKNVAVPDVLQVSQATAGDKCDFKRELELIEALRRAQRDEAQALEHQRELIEKLRAVNAREAAVEREQIESLRRAQQEEAKKLSTQKEEVDTEKAALQRKWEELEQKKEQLLSTELSREHPASVSH
ncbi:uncharacterized protein LOC129178699 [Dunckerocampus dactyliophorus]|uniref:uncharacterized protein LOC129178699 n=1 Tax=Dunckerocampus dactyliophorus TaxID=161453 RepID=UPI0024069D9C|nr:uncharacterized protein LOC129178699 [Dunckerocampus dactyliophorus]